MIGHKRLAAATFIGVFLFGLAGPAYAGGPRQPHGFVVRNNAADCSEGYTGTFVSFAQAQKSLPRGYVAGDGGVFFGAPLGMALFSIGSDVCRRADIDPGRGEADVLIYIQTPRIRGVSTVPGEYDYYVPYFTTSSRKLAAIMRRAGVSLALAKVTATVSPMLPGGGGAGSGASKDASGKGFSYDFAAPVPPSPTNPLTVFWFQTKRGVLKMDFVVDNLLWYGTAYCTITSPAVARQAGFSTCPVGTTGFAQTGGGWKAKIAFYPGARPS